MKKTIIVLAHIAFLLSLVGVFSVQAHDWRCPSYGSQIVVNKTCYPIYVYINHEFVGSVYSNRWVMFTVRAGWNTLEAQDYYGHYNWGPTSSFVPPGQQ